MEIVGVRVGNEKAEPLVLMDGTAMLMLVRVRQAQTDEPLLLKQFNASQLILEGLDPTSLDPGQEVEIKRFEDGGYEVNTSLDDAADAM